MDNSEHKATMNHTRTTPPLDLKKYRLELLRRCNIPPKHFQCSFDTFNGGDLFTRKCKEYNEGGLVLHGKTGTGKTHLAVAILRRMLENKEDELLKTSYDPPPIFFKSVPDILLALRESFKNKDGDTEGDIVDFYSEIPVLALDDLGSEKTTEFTITSLYVIIDRRDRNLLQTIITTNLTLKEIEDKLGARIASRLAGMVNITINMTDYRKKRG